MRIAVALAAALLAACASGPAIDTRICGRQPGQPRAVPRPAFHLERLSVVAETLTEGEVSAITWCATIPRPCTGSWTRAGAHGTRARARGSGYANLNEGSIGIEIVNRGTELGDWQPYPDAQVEVVIALVKDIVRRHGIRPERIVGHSDIAPQRKAGPGPALFREAARRRGTHPLARRGGSGAPPARVRGAPSRRAMVPAHARAARLCRASNGELDEETRRVVAAFQMKYRPARFDGIPDAETAALVDVLVNP
jgi:N-acetylmuramoyl-L-alanine amidase